MKCIIVIRGVDDLEYNDIKADLAKQMLGAGIEPVDMPIFTRLPQLPDERAEIEVVWLDPEMELANYRTMLEFQNRSLVDRYPPEKVVQEVIADIDKMKAAMQS